MEAVFLKLLNMSVTASLLIMAVIPLRLLLKRAPKWTACLLWLLVAVALVLPVRPQSPVSVMPHTEPIAVDMAPALPAYTPDASAPTADVFPDEEAAPVRLLQIGSWIWLAGMVAMGASGAWSWLRLKRRVAASIEVAPGVSVCDDIDTPFILGLVRPHIYLPSALDDLAAQQVLAHERAHLTRKDHWWKPMGFLLLTLHWFNPFVWVAYVLLCRDIELACDEKVIRTMDEQGKKQYSRVLLQCSMPRHLLTACPLAFGEVGVKARITAVLHYKKPALWLILAALLVCVGLCFGFLTDPMGDSDGDIAMVSPTPTPSAAPDYNGILIPADAMKSALEASLNGRAIDYSQASLPAAFYDSTGFTCVVRSVDCITDNNVLHTDEPLSIHLVYADGKYSFESIVPQDNLTAFLLSGDVIPVTVSPDSTPTVSAELWVTLDTATGEILAIAGGNLMSDSFRGYEPLYNAIRSHTALSRWTDPVLVAATDFNGSSYAVVRYTVGRETKSAMVEYRTDAAGVKLLTVSPAEEPNTTYGHWKTGFQLNGAAMSEDYIYWSVIADRRIYTTPDGSQSDYTVLVDNDITAIRFVMQDLSTVDIPITGRLFITDYNFGAFPPRICVPVDHGTVLSALGMGEPIHHAATHFDK